MNRSQQREQRSKTPTLDFLRENQWKHEEAEEELAAFLRKRGWKHTSDTPGSYWMWERKLKGGRTLLVATETAARIEEELCGEEYEETD